MVFTAQSLPARETRWKAISNNNNNNTLAFTYGGRIYFLFRYFSKSCPADER
jgi:hypothetical protein